MRQLLVLTMALLAVSTKPLLGQLQGPQDSPCFTPLPNTERPQDFTQWSTIYSKQLPSTAILADSKGFKKYQRLDTDASGSINLDYYGLSFRRDQSNPAEPVATIYDKLRRAFYYVAVSPSSDAPLGFFPYQDVALTNPSGDSQVGKHNRDRWESTNPLGAMMTFIVSNQPYTLFSLDPSKMGLAFKTISVVVVCASKQDFIFSTVTSDGDGIHPVSGYRGFGLRDNSDGSLTFYTMGTDRETYISDQGAQRLHPYPGNLALRLGAMSPKIPMGSDAPFIAGDQFWIEFFGNLQSYLNRHNYQTTPYTANRLSNRYPYPLVSGATQPPAPADHDVENEIKNDLDQAFAIPGDNSVELRIEEALRRATAKRDAPGMSQDETLRDAEYYLHGLYGATAHDWPHVILTLSAPVYNSIKWAALRCNDHGFSAPAELLQSHSGSPLSEPGGSEWAYRGLKDGSIQNGNTVTPAQPVNGLSLPALNVVAPCVVN